MHTMLDLRKPKRHCLRIAASRQRIDPRTSWISQPQQLRHLVVRLACRIVYSATNVAITPRALFALLREIPRLFC